jgi:SEC-C motif-containing protein
MVSTCPCGLAASYDDCCGRFHRGDAAAPTAERLMRSRFSAFAFADADYLLRTWHPTSRPGRLDLDRALRWTRLEVLETSEGSALHTTGTVRFRAHYRGRTRPGMLEGHSGTLEEHSRFVAEAGNWFYVGPS